MQRGSFAQVSTWLHFFADLRFVKPLHRLVLTEDANEVWFQDCGADFPTGLARIIHVGWDKVA